MGGGDQLVQCSTAHLRTWTTAKQTLCSRLQGLVRLLPKINYIAASHQPEESEELVDADHLTGDDEPIPKPQEDPRMNHLATSHIRTASTTRPHQLSIRQTGISPRVSVTRSSSSAGPTSSRHLCEELLTHDENES